MEEGLKQRLVGAVVLVLLAVIFVPMLLESGSGPGDAGLDLGTQQPSGDSEFSSRIIPVEQPPRVTPDGLTEADSEISAGSEQEEEDASNREDRLVEATTGAIVLPVPADNTKTTTASGATPEAPGSAETPPVKEASGVSVPPDETEEASPSPAWAAQLGSFAEHRNALVLRNRLRAKGYAAFTESVVGDQGEITRVLVGPEPTRERTVSTIEALRRDTGLDAFVVRHPRE